MESKMESISRSILSSRFSCVLHQNSVKEDKRSNISRTVSGSFGKVINLDWNGTICAGKILHIVNYGEDMEKEYVEAFNKEIKLWQEMSHPHIVQLHGIWIQPGTELPYMVMELLKCSLHQYLKSTAEIPVRTKLGILCDVAKGLVYLHKEKKFAHRDLTTSNILLTSTLMAKIGDFGQSRLIEGQINKLTSCPGNASFMPPEACTSTPTYDLSIDTFSYGCVTLHTITQQFPTPLPSVERSEDNKVRRTLTEIQRREHYINLMESESPLRSLTCQCLEDDKHKRPRATEILSAIKGKNSYS